MNIECVVVCAVICDPKVLLDNVKTENIGHSLWVIPDFGWEPRKSTILVNVDNAPDGYNAEGGIRCCDVLKQIRVGNNVGGRGRVHDNPLCG